MTWSKIKCPSEALRKLASLSTSKTLKGLTKCLTRVGLGYREGTLGSDGVLPIEWLAYWGESAKGQVALQRPHLRGWYFGVGCE